MKNGFVLALSIFVISLNGATLLAATDNPGYKGVEWGADYQRLRELKSSSESPRKDSEEITGLRLFDKDIYALLGTPIAASTTLGAKRFTMIEKCVPESFSNSYVKEDDVRYIFYKGKFAMAFSEIESKDLSRFEATLRKKYPKANRINKNIPPPDGDTSSSVSATLFRGSGVTIWLATDRGVGEGLVSTYHFLLYADPVQWELIGADIARCIKELTAGESAAAEKDNRRESGKIE